MKCPHLVDEQPNTAALCVEGIVPSEPSKIDHIQLGYTSRHRHCALCRDAGSPLSLAIHQEVARAIG